MENYLYTCGYCSKSYKPNRRRKQKYCSNSCRTRAYTLRNGKLSLSKPIIVNKNKEQTTIDKISLAGVGNAAIGNLAVNVMSKLLTSEGEKPATKNDLKNLTSLLKERYQVIKNIPVRNDGAKPYFDFLSQTLVYF